MRTSEHKEAIRIYHDVMDLPDYLPKQEDPTPTHQSFKDLVYKYDVMAANYCDLQCKYEALEKLWKKQTEELQKIRKYCDNNGFKIPY